MKVLLIGSGGREHALALKIAASPVCEQLFIAPGNPGTAKLGTNTLLNIADHAGVAQFCRDKGITLVVVGPEAPLVAGIADDLAKVGIAVFGPSKAAAQLEGSKDFTKQLCVDAKVPTAAYATFTALTPALAYVREQGAPIVVKYDGLMGGKGVTVAASVVEAEAALNALYANESNAVVVIEECLMGEEASFFCLVDGETVLSFGSAQDHKRVFDGDTGPNTGGMGAYSPAPVVTPAVERRTLEEIVIPSMKEMAKRGTPYRGVLFAGLMIDESGAPKLIEYNCRFGDPECQALMLRLESDLLPLLDATARGQLAGQAIALKPLSAVGVVMAARGYPGDFAKGSAIRGLEKADAMEGVTVIHAGTRADGQKILANGGRVLTICGVGRDLPEARTRAYDAIKAVDWPEGFNRSDIGAKGLARLNTEG
jgi:phosphoribosylamine---glycine ligase